MDVFGPIAKWHEALHDIQAIGIDVMGTAINRHGELQRDVLDLVLHLNRTYVDLAVTFISTDPACAMGALVKAGVRNNIIKNGVTLKKDFYDHAAETGDKVVSLDDEASQADRADIHINPKDEAVIDYLHRHPYRRGRAPAA